MAKIEDLLKELDKLDLPKEEYAVIGSGPLGIRGIRESKDLDILVSDRLWVELSQKYPLFDKEGEIVIKISEDLEAAGTETFKNNGPDIPSVDEMLAKSETIKGYPFMSLEHFVFFKKRGVREKDKNDLKLLEGWQKRKK